MRLPGQILSLVGLGAVVGIALNGVSAHPAPLGHPVFAASASGTAMCSAGGGEAHVPRHPLMAQSDAVAACTACSAGFVDARGAAAFANGHIPGAIHLPPVGEVDEAATLASLRRYAVIVVYDAGSGCHLAEAVADRLGAAGFDDVRILDGSWAAWQAAGGPAESGACQACAAHERESESEAR